MYAKTGTRMGATEGLPGANPPDPGPSLGLRVVAMVLRAVFIGALLVVTARVSVPQSESVWSAYETPGDLIRLGLGVAVGVWILAHLFTRPKDPEAYRTWVYVGLVLAPLGLLIAFAAW